MKRSPFRNSKLASREKHHHGSWIGGIHHSEPRLAAGPECGPRAGRTEAAPHSRGWGGHCAWCRWSEGSSWHRFFLLPRRPAHACSSQLPRWARQPGDRRSSQNGQEILATASSKTSSLSSYTPNDSPVSSLDFSLNFSQYLQNI